MSIKKSLIFLLIIIVILIARIYFEINYVEVKEIVLRSKKLPKGKKFKILHISDLHNKKWSKDKRDLLKAIEKFQPDIIALTGDIIDEKTNDFDNVYRWLDELMAINKDIYFVSGNHEWKNRKAKEFMEGLKKRNIKIINNSNEILKKDGFRINICGIDDPYTNHEDLDKAFNNIDKNDFTLLLSHAPNIIFKRNTLPCDLILCGHTHGGQIRFPFIGGLIAPGQGIFPKYDKGLYRLENGTMLYINSGLGTSKFPIRFLNRSQVSFITLIEE